MMEENNQGVTNYETGYETGCETGCETNQETDHGTDQETGDHKEMKHQVSQEGVRETSLTETSPMETSPMETSEPQKPTKLKLTAKEFVMPQKLEAKPELKTTAKEFVMPQMVHPVQRQVQQPVQQWEYKLFPQPLQPPQTPEPPQPPVRLFVAPSQQVVQPQRQRQEQQFYKPPRPLAPMQPMQPMQPIQPMQPQRMMDDDSIPEHVKQEHIRMMLKYPPSLWHIHHVHVPRNLPHKHPYPYSDQPNVVPAPDADFRSVNGYILGFCARCKAAGTAKMIGIDDKGGVDRNECPTYIATGFDCCGRRPQNIGVCEPCKQFNTHPGQEGRWYCGNYATYGMDCDFKKPGDM